MKVLLLTLLSMVVFTLAHPDYSDTWEEFKEKFNKEYESEEEEVDSGGNWNRKSDFSSPQNQRSAIWSSNVDLIKEHNGQVFRTISRDISEAPREYLCFFHKGFFFLFLDTVGNY